MPTITSTAPATSAYLKTQTVSYTLSEAGAAGTAIIAASSTGGTADATVHSCVLQGTALTGAAHNNLTLETGENACVEWASPLVNGSIYTFTFNSSDAAGNPAVAVTNTSVTYDTGAPTLTTVSIASNNASTTLAKTGDIVTLTFIASENLASEPTVTIATHAIAADDVDQGIDAQHWTAVYTMVGGDSTGAVPFTINFTDIATNPGVEVIAVTEGGGSVTFDKTVPTVPDTVTFSATGGTVTANTLNNTNTNFVATSTIVAGEATGGYAELLKAGSPFSTPIRDNTILVGDVSVSFDAGLSSTSTLQTAFAATGELSVVLYDAAGNPATSTVANPTVTVDYVVPTITSVALGSDEYVNSTETGTGVNIVIATTGLENGRTVSCTITGTTGSVGPVTGAVTSNAVTIASTALTALADGTITATCNVTDTAGNPAVAGTDTATKDVIIPTLESVVGSSIQGAGDTITLTFSEPIHPASDGSWSSTEITTLESPNNTAKTLVGATFNPTSGATTTITITLAEGSSLTTYLRNGNDVAVTVGSNVIKDAAGNPVAAGESVSAGVVSGDSDEPTVALTYSPDRTVTPLETIRITATFNEAMYETTPPTIAIATPGDGGLSATAMTKTSSTVWYYDWVVPGLTDEQGTATSTIVATDLAGNSNTAATNSTRTIDSIAPIVNTFTATSITATGALLTVTTNEAATCAYANTEKAYGSMTEMATTTGVMTHLQALTGLTAATTYNYYVRCADTSNNVMVASAHVSFTTSGSDESGPTVSSIYPTNGVTGVAITTAPYIDFSEALRTSSITTSTVKLLKSSDDSLVTASVSIANGGTRVIVTPASSLANSTGYYLYATTGVKDEAGNAMSSAYGASSTSAFTTVSATSDTTAPVITDVQMSTSTVTTATIIWTTDELSSSTVQYGTTSNYGSSETTSTLVSSHSVVLTGLASGTTYHFRVKSTDAAGNTGTSVDNIFITPASDLVGPTVSSQSPSDGATTTAITASPTITFSEAMDASTLNSATVQLREYTGDAAINSVILYNPETYVLTIDPVASLSNSTQYYLWITGAKDAAGNSLTTDYSTSTKSSHEFTTVAESAVTLAVTQVAASSTYATAGGGWSAGWSWVFTVTVPTSETSSSMKFADWISGSNSIDAADNIRYYSAQSSNASTTASAITISAANTYGDAMTLNADLDATTAGRQIQIIVEAQVPDGTAGGSYSTSYGIQTQ